MENRFYLKKIFLAQIHNFFLLLNENLTGILHVVRNEHIDMYFIYLFPSFEHDTFCPLMIKIVMPIYFDGLVIVLNILIKRQKILVQIKEYNLMGSSDL